MLQPIRRAPFALMGFLIWLCACGCIGVIGLITLLVLGLMGKLRHGFGALTGRGPVYAEAFAIFIGVFTGAHLLHDALSSRMSGTMSSGLLAAFSILMQVTAFAGAITWAIVRCGSWRDVRQDVGLHAGRGIVREFMAGVLTYCMAVPMLIVGFALTWMLLAVQKWYWPDAPMPTHPAQEMLKDAGWLTTLQIFALGSIVAPIIEETAFRGMLYRHLRELSGRWTAIPSVVVSAGLSSLMFAAIHPQGWAVIPALASLALAFCLAKEWRGSLIPGMVAHGLNNLVMMTLMVIVFRG